MEQPRYIFEDAAHPAELERLLALESVCDSKTQSCLLSTGALAGLHCLEVGAGAGSIAAWMQKEVGPKGGVVAIDTNVRFLERLEPAIKVIEGDIRAIPEPGEPLDLVHARYVLIHNADAGAVLDAMLRWLKPGGWLVLEEPDFNAAGALAGPPPLRHAFENVKRAIGATFANRGMDHAFGRRLPGLLEERSVEIASLECDCPVERGGSALAQMMRLSATALRDKYVSTGHASAEDISRYGEFAGHEGCWGIYYATVRVLARKAIR